MGLSANSPFWHGHNTGYASYRHRVLASTRSYGMPPSFASWDEFVHFYNLAKKARVYESINDIHWDMRPRPHLGTLEIRIMDAQSSIQDAILRTAFIHALVSYLREQPTLYNNQTEYEYNYWLQKDNLYQASRLGMDAHHIDHSTEVVSNLRQVFDSVFYPMVNFFEQAENNVDNIDLNYLYRLREQVETSEYGYSLQRNIYTESLSLKNVSKTLVNKLESDIDHFFKSSQKYAKLI
jgi:carboxylate-amine ligase